MQHSKTSEEFYHDVLSLLTKEKIPFLVGGTHAVSAYTGIQRPTKDLDIYTKPGDYMHVLEVCNKNYTVEITDTRWLAKIAQGDFFIDVLFGTANETCRVDDSWFQHAPQTSLFDLNVQLVPVEELIWIKSFMQDRRRSEGPDVNHLFLRKGRDINWKHLLMRMDAYWEILFSHIMEFRFIYPSEREIIPKNVMEDMIERVQHELALPVPKEKICRGVLLSRIDYEVDIKDWGFKTVLEI